MTGIRVETDGRGVERLSLSRAEKRNALDSAMIAALSETAAGLAEDRAVRVVVLAAEGAVFSAGGAPVGCPRGIGPVPDGLL